MLKKMFEEKLRKVKPRKSDEIGKDEYYPSIYLTSKNVPEIKDWKPGEDYYLVLKVEQKSVNIDSEDEEEKKYSANFDIKEIGVLDNSKDKNEETNKKEELKSKYL